MKTIRIISLLFCLVLVLTASVGTMAFAEEVKADSSYVLSETVDIWPDEVEGVTQGLATCHGQNQTRLLYTESGLYFSCPLNDYKEVGGSYGDRTEIGFWRINPDNTVDFLYRYSIYFVAAGTTSNVMADKDGNVWICSSWDEGSGFYHLYGMKYDVKTGEISEYTATRYAKKGANGGGKPVSIMDAANNRIYQFGHGRAGKNNYLTWYILDLATGEWSQIYQVKTPAYTTFYHYGYALGQGFFIITENADDNYIVPTDIPGMDGATAMSQFHSRSYIAGQIWWNSVLIYVPDATVAEGYCHVVHESEFDVANGEFSNNFNANNDLYFDKTTGYLYSIITLECDGVADYRKVIQVFDTKQLAADPVNEIPFKLVYEKDIEFLYGNGDDYFQHIFKDATGKLYIVAVTSQCGEVEFWEINQEPNVEIKLVYTEEFRGYISGESAENTYGMIVANERNNSIVDDTCRMALWNTEKRAWIYFTIDFGTLRQNLLK